MSAQPCGPVVFRHAWRLVRRGSLIWGAVFALLTYSSIVGFESGYPTAVERAQLAFHLSSSTGVQALFGHVHGVDTVQGFTAWRTGGLVPLVAAVWGLLSATRLLRGEEELGRWEAVLAGAITPTRSLLVCLAALASALAVTWAAIAATLLVFGVASHGFPLAGSLYLALQLVAAGSVFMAVGALAAQLTARRRQAAALAGGVFGVALVLRMAADSSASADWLRWLTPLGWVEEMRPLTGAQPAALIPIVALVVALAAAATLLAARRDLGGSVLRSHDAAEPNLTLLGSPFALEFRTAGGGAMGWAAGVGAAAFIFGLISKSVAQATGSSRAVQQASAQFGTKLGTAEGYLGLTFLFLVVAISLYAASHAASAREEEASSRLDALLSQPVARVRWLAGRLGVAALYLSTAALSAGLLGWAGTLVAGAGVPLDRMLEAAINVMPVALLFLGIGTLALGLLPRETAGLAFGAVAITFLLEIVGAIIKAPTWLLDLSPFHHIAFVPAASIDADAALVMLGIGALAAAVGVAVFDRRDLVAD